MLSTKSLSGSCLQTKLHLQRGFHIAVCCFSFVYEHLSFRQTTKERHTLTPPVCVEQIIGHLELPPQMLMGKALKQKELIHLLAKTCLLSSPAPNAVRTAGHVFSM